MKTQYLLLAFASLLVFAGLGCSRVGDTVAEQAINSELNGEGSVDVDGDTIRFENAEGETVQTGSNAQIPEGFPKDLLQYPDSTVVTVADTNNGSSLTLTTSDDKQEVVSWYENQMYGWTLEGQMSLGGQETRLYKKDNVRVTILVRGGDGITTITVARQVE